jgi:hypothetical protein
MKGKIIRTSPTMEDLTVFLFLNHFLFDKKGIDAHIALNEGVVIESHEKGKTYDHYSILLSEEMVKLRFGTLPPEDDTYRYYLSYRKVYKDESKEGRCKRYYNLYITVEKKKVK